ncbi:MAG: radical SAM protein, partial [Candidatus Electrothrix sp. AUS4]|nr:radical SAM protein [Candidatus Electrothrix sp. AUS4]
MFHLVSINCRYSHSCLALFYVRNALEQHLPEQPLLFSQFTINDPYYATLLRISRTEAKAVFFSVYIWNHAFIRRLMHDLARLLPDLPIILGGPEAPALGELPKQCSLFLGEIEGAPQAFYQDLERGRLQAVYQAERTQNFPSPYRQEDFADALQHRQLYYESSRGCPFSCSYCLSSGSKGVRHKPVELVKEELTALIAADPMIIKLVDRTFNDHPERALAIWQFLIESAQQVRFHFEIAPDRFTEPMFDLLATVPCDQFQFEIGIQSCHEPTLSAVQRRMDLAAACHNIQRLLALDSIHLHVDLILGLPFETQASFRDSFNQVFRLAPHYIQLGLLKVLPETEIARRTEEFG